MRARGTNTDLYYAQLGQKHAKLAEFEKKRINSIAEEANIPKVGERKKRITRRKVLGPNPLSVKTKAKKRIVEVRALRNTQPPGCLSIAPPSSRSTATACGEEEADSAEEEAQAQRAEAVKPKEGRSRGGRRYTERR